MQPRSTLHRLALSALLLVAFELGAAVASAQTIDEHFEPILTPPSPGAHPPAIQQSLEEGYRLLAQVEDPSDETPLEAAKAAFERAVEGDPRSALAWNGRGIYELIKDEGWLVLLESLKKLFNRDHISMAIKAFERALETDPQFHAARYNLALAYRQARGEENLRKAVAQLERLVEEAPATGNAPLLLVLTYRDLGDREAMEQSLESMPENEAFPRSSQRLLLAFALINGERPAEGAEAYWEGIDAIASDQEAKLFWHDIRPVATLQEDGEFATLSVDQQKAFLREYWQRLADQAFVPVSERLSEHYRRLDHAYRNFRIDLPERRHYSTIAAYVPPWQTGFDDRGVIYLRHGPPDDEATYAGPEVERNLSWMYERPGDDPLVFHFVSDEDVGDYKLVKQLSDAVIQSSANKMTGTTTLQQRAECSINRRCDAYDARTLAADARSMQVLYSSRGHLDPLYDRVAMGLDPQLLDEERSELAQDIEVATKTSSFRPPEESLRYPVRAVSFRNPGGRNAVAFYYALPASQVDVLSLPDGRSAVDYRHQLRIEPLQGGEPIRDEEETRLVAGSIPREPGVLLPRVRWVDLSPGQYQFGLRLTDMSSGRSGLTQGDVMVDAATAGLSLSGIVLATGVTPAQGTNDPFVRWGRWRVVPLPSHMFRRSQPVYVYYEAYGLAMDESGAARYRTTYTLESGNPDRNVVARFFSAVGERLFGGEEKGSISYEFEHSRGEEVDPTLEFFSLDVSESPAGEYVLTIEVEDLIGGGTARRQARLTLVE
ncbi:MAG: GWxTD domain-containing protein [Gemmatimonadota bacterium]